jgi:hypothetical protein
MGISLGKAAGMGRTWWKGVGGPFLPGVVERRLGGSGVGIPVLLGVGWLKRTPSFLPQGGLARRVVGSTRG